ncbi:MAG: (d)CMP kinase [Deltaproteobacteria bacterium]|nr:(d)CMP kinase [Deltaproteobacteria bacterium]
MNRDNLIIAVDGPAGSGKSTVANLLAEKLNGRKLDTGAIYRSFAWFMIQNDISLEGGNIDNLVESFDISFSDGKIFINDTDVTHSIRTPEISSAASKVAVRPEIRNALFSTQRKLASPGPTVCEGRDMGTVVFPDAPFKFFLTATPEKRAMRRFLELSERGDKTPFEDILRQQIERDKRDSERDIAPLRAAEDATVIDSSEMTAVQVVDFILDIISNH